MACHLAAHYCQLCFVTKTSCCQTSCCHMRKHVVNSRGQSLRACCVAQHGERRLRKGEHIVQRRGVYTAPMKRGGFGYNKTTLSEMQGYKGVVRGGTH